jgi:serine/threonine protein kinase
MHRDVKGANILLDGTGTLKLADFGLAKQYDQFRKVYTNKVVTLWYRAPELLLGSYQYNKLIDIWSVGCFLAELFIGKPLFPGDVEARQIDLIFQICGTPDYETWPNLTYLNAFAELKPKIYPNRLEEHFKGLDLYPEKLDDLGIDLIKGMLTMWPEKRFDVEQWLKHPYFTSDPLPCDKSELPKIEGEAHEHALREDRKEIRKAEALNQAHGMQYPTTQRGNSNGGNGNQAQSHK